LTPLIVLPDDEASRRLMRETDVIYDQRHREHSRNGCVSMAREHLCKTCRSYEAGRNVALELVRALVEVDPAVPDDAGQSRCLYCRAELNGEESGPAKEDDPPHPNPPPPGGRELRGHEATCAWQSVKQLLDRPGGPEAPRAV
jgi:hypothetical protein